MATADKPKPARRERMPSLTLTCRQWQIMHDLLYAVLTSPKRADLRKRTGPDNLERCKNMLEIIKAHTLDRAELEAITITDTTWVMVRIPWVINEAAGYRINGLNSELVSNIYNQLQRVK